MTSDKGILIQNIYYMLAYAFQTLRQENYQELASEKFEHAYDLFAAILAKGIAQQLKKGLYRDYIEREELLTTLRGKLELSGTIRERLQHHRKLACVFDELSENNLFNRILKTTVMLLIRQRDVATEQKQALKRLLPLLSGVEELDPASIRWNRIRLQRSNLSYEMLLNVCRLILEGMLQTTEDGVYRLATFSDEHMERLYEKFILEYYRKHHKHLKATSAQIKWDLDEDTDPNCIRFLPTMQSDIMLHSGYRTLIIDAKYYGRTMQSHFGSQSIHSGNLYQIFTYVKNQEASQPGPVSGMLLYAKTEEAIVPNYTFGIGGNRISVKTLDLNQPFSLIAAQLDQIAKSIEE